MRCGIWPWLAIFSAVAATASFGQGEGPSRGGDRPAGSSLLAMFDRDGDGVIKADEIDMAVAVLRRMDRDGDGELSGDELAPPRPTKPGARGGDKPSRQRGAQMLARLDKDGDGKISKEEAPERMRGRFDRLDKDGDGFLDKEEQAAMLEMFRRRLRDAGGDRKRLERDAGGGAPEKPKRPPVEG